MMTKTTSPARRLVLAWVLLPMLLTAQQTISLDDLSAWKPSTAAGNWQIAGDVTADLNENEKMATVKGKGILVNLPDAQNKANLLSVAEYGDVDVSFDFMMAKHSNSGFYLQGRYEVQLLDSWGAQNPRYGDCGGIYARRRFVPEEQMFEGHAPRQNACLAPGLWQHIDISFQAPRFDAGGKKISPAQILKIVLNGVLIHENVTLTGPTGGPISEQEAATGPFMIQGDHGPVAFRNFVVTPSSGTPPGMGPVAYKVWYGKFREPGEFLNKKPDLSGVTEKLNWAVSKQESNFGIVYNTSLLVPKAGKHRITTQIAGRYMVKVNGKEVLPDSWTHSSGKRTADIELPTGASPLEITVYKIDDWMPPVVGFWLEGPGTRPVAYHTLSSVLGLPYSDPIFLDAKEPMVFRSFMDLQFREGQPTDYPARLSHAVNVGHPLKLHYTYNLDNGGLPQIWKGEFLYTSPMWDDRGDGSSRPRGAVLSLGDYATVINANATPAKPAAELPPGSFTTTLERMQTSAQYRPLGYDTDANNLPTFRYQIYGAEVEDQLRVSEGGQYLTRTLQFKQLPAGQALLCRLAVGSNIADLGNGLWSVDNKKYIIRVAAGTQARVDTINGQATLVTPAAAQVQYAIMW